MNILPRVSVTVTVIVTATVTTVATVAVTVTVAVTQGLPPYKRQPWGGGQTRKALQKCFPFADGIFRFLWPDSAPR